MNYSIFDFLTLIGSLSLFLFGMKTMSDGIQKVAGERLRSILGAMTRNRFMGVVTGFIITSIIQSSSATTVMIVSFVNAGLLSLMEAIGVIMGANIGTTVTAWLISILGFKVKMELIAVPLIGIGFPMLFSKKDRLNSAGETIIGFALLFIGLGFMKSAVPDLESAPELFKGIQSLTEYGFGSTLIFVGIGTLLTVVLQSSSASIALVMVMCNNGWINFESAAAIVLGENIGTTITANLAALIANVHAKRSALAHTVFNLIGVIWILILFKPFLNMINHFSIELGWGAPLDSIKSIKDGLALFHSSFNIINTVLLIGFVKHIEKLVRRVLSSKKEEDEEYQLEYIGSKPLNASELSIFEARREVHKYGITVKKMFKLVPEYLNEKDEKKRPEFFEHIKRYEDICDKTEIQLADFLLKVSQSELSEDSSTAVRSMLRMINHLENTGDMCYHMGRTIQRKNEAQAWFTQYQRDKLQEMFDLLDKIFDVTLHNLENSVKKADMEKAIELETQLNNLRDQIRDEHFRNVEKGDYNIKSGIYYNNLYSACEKVGDHLLSVNEAITGINVE